MIAITGYTGFVGLHLLELLQTSDVLLLGRQRLSNFKKFKQFDLNATQGLDLAHDLQLVETVIHLAARVHVMKEEIKEPISAFSAVNTEGTLNLARQAAQAGVKRFIFLSSIKVNGEGTDNRAPFTADDMPAPRDPYAISKAVAEQQLFELSKQTGMEIVIIRPPLVYGEGVKANFLSLMRFVGKGLPLPLRAIKSNKRSLVSVYNLVDLIKLCITHPRAANQVFLASDDHDLSTAQMVALMAKVQNKKNLSFPIPVWFLNLVGKLLNNNGVIDRLTGSLQLDISHTKKTLSWTPPYSVEHCFKLAAKRPSNKNYWGHK